MLNITRVVGQSFLVGDHKITLVEVDTQTKEAIFQLDIPKDTSVTTYRGNFKSEGKPIVNREKSKSGFMIGDTIGIQVFNVGRTKVMLGIIAPKEMRITRSELLEGKPFGKEKFY